MATPEDPSVKSRQGEFMARRNFSDEELRLAVDHAKSIAGVLRHLGLRVGGGNYRTISRSVKRLELDTSHWTGQGHRKGSSIPVVRALPLLDLLRRGSTYSSNRLRRRLLNEGLLQARCSMCGLHDWLERPIPLELDHIDGDRENNELANLRLLCPNCHALTPTYRGRNKTPARHRQRARKDLPLRPG